MSNILLLNQPFVQVGVGSGTNLTFTVPTTGLYAVEAQLTENPPSSCVLTIQQNGSTVYTSPTITPTQIAFQMKQGFQFTAADAIVIALASAAANDLLLNTVKWTATIQQGL